MGEERLYPLFSIMFRPILHCVRVTCIAFCVTEICFNLVFWEVEEHCFKRCGVLTIL